MKPIIVPRPRGTYVPKLLSALIITLGLWLNSQGSTPKQDTERAVKWQDAEKAFTINLFTQPFIDSLKQAKNIPDNRGLRSAKGTLKPSFEKMVFEAGWGPISAGYGILTNSSSPESKQFYSRLKGMSNPFVSTFYKVNDYLASTMDLGGLYPLFFEEHVQEGRYSAKRWALFNHRDSTCYTNKVNYERIPMTPFSHDLLSLMHYLRIRTLSPGDTFTIKSVIQGKTFDVFFRVSHKEQIKLAIGTFRCVVVEPQLSGEGRVFSKRDKIQIWMSDDNYHIPVLIKSKIKVGSVYGELVYYNRLD
jgi:hypothetical protein